MDLRAQAGVGELRGEGPGAVQLGLLRPTPASGYVDFELLLDPADGAYDYSKLYFSIHPGQPFDEARVLCFRVGRARRFERVRLVLPEGARDTGYLRLRLDGLPYSPGAFRVRALSLVEGWVGDDLSRRARLRVQKQWVRREVERSEAMQRAVLPHYPESLSLELTPRCNLACGHCGSHGTAERHRRHNRAAGLHRGILAALGHEVFPHLTQVTAVGRGEPLLSGQATWELLIDLLASHEVLLCCVTNGCFIERRIDEAAVAVLDTLTVSIDGLRPETFARNRGGADLRQVLRGVARYCELRQASPRARRPRLGFSWTLKENNVAEFPGFVRFIRQFDPDYLYVRHLLTFFEKDRDQSLVDRPEITDRYLAEAYAEIDGARLKLDCPPLTGPEDRDRSALARPGSGESFDPGVPAREGAARAQGRCPFIYRTGVVMADGEVVTCANMYAEHAGHMGGGGDFLSAWNGRPMQLVRRGLGTESEWRQCSSCWLREVGYQDQRDAWSHRSRPLGAGAKYSPQAWDFRGYEEPADGESCSE